jgi:hypothetical protein
MWVIAWSKSSTTYSSVIAWSKLLPSHYFVVVTTFMSVIGWSKSFGSNNFVAILKTSACGVFNAMSINLSD